MEKLQPIRLVKAANALVSLADLKKHLEVEHDEDDAFIEGLSAAAYEHVTGVDTPWQRVWMTERWRDFWPDFSRRSLLRLAPAKAVARITWLAPDEDTEWLIDPAAYYLMQEPGGARVCFKSRYRLPTELADRPDAVRIDYDAGYGVDPGDPPAGVGHAIRLMVGHWYRNREDVVITSGQAQTLPMGVEALLAPFRRIGVEAWDNPPSLPLPSGSIDATAGLAVTLS